MWFSYYKLPHVNIILKEQATICLPVLVMIENIKASVTTIPKETMKISRKT